MMGYSVGFASFHVVEVMSSPDFFSKRIGYLAASQSFSPTTDVLLLTTNQFKKDMTSIKMQDCSQALTCLSKLVTEELGRDLENDVSLLLNSPRPYIRKKALLVLYRLIMVHPDTLPVVSARFKERLKDKDPSVVCAAVTVTCELARAAPRSFLSLAPVLYQLLLSKDSSNWMLIKIVKLMGVLTPLEPRLGKKLVEPLTTLMRSTRAKSLLYECCSTVTLGLLAYPEAVELCAQRLGEFMNDRDQNLKYLGLQSMRKLIQEQPQVAVEHRDNIIDCLDDEDIGIRMRALDLVSEFISKRTLRDVSRIILRKLRNACADGFPISTSAQSDNKTSFDGLETPALSAPVDQEAPYRSALAKELLRAGDFRRSSNAAKRGYEMLSTGDDFAWYMNVILGGLAEISMLPQGIREMIGDQLVEITSRVEAIRPVSLKVALSLLELRVRPLENTGSETTPTTHQTSEAESETNSDDEEEEPDDNAVDVNANRARSPLSCKPVLSANLAGSAAWIAGEYCELIDDHAQACKILTSFPRKYLDSPAQVRVLTACVKIYCTCRDECAENLRAMVLEYAKALIGSQFAEVQERACFFSSLLTEIHGSERNLMTSLFEGKLIPVDHRAQSKVPVGPDLDLDIPLLDTGSDSLYTYLLRTIGSTEEEGDIGEDEGDLFKEFTFGSTTLSITDNTAVQSSSANVAQRGLLSNYHGAQSKTENPFYLGSSGKQTKDRTTKNVEGSEEDVSKVKYDTTHLTSEAAVVIAEENPLGLQLSDEENGQDTASNGNARLQAAFEGAFDHPPSNASKKDEKRKKKKKKKKKGGANGHSKEKTTSKIAVGQQSLIDFDTAPSEPGGSSTTTTAKASINMTESLI
ncbi:Adaptin [Gracilaria domingensis]|nr:Adaptin [Gracilaria domingensis]